MNSKSSLFLIELMIATLFFALSATVCVQMFVKAHLISGENARLNQASILSQDLSDCWLSSPQADWSQIVEELGFTLQSDDQGDLGIFLNQDWKNCEKIEASYFVKLRSESAGNMINAEISIIDLVNDNKSLIDWDLSSYIPLEKGAA